MPVSPSELLDDDRQFAQRSLPIVSRADAQPIRTGARFARGTSASIGWLAAASISGVAERAKPSEDQKMVGMAGFEPTTP
jgi:hypothetical protein